jgi:hypothetical protein
MESVTLAGAQDSLRMGRARLLAAVAGANFLRDQLALQNDGFPRLLSISTFSPSDLVIRRTNNFKTFIYDK